MCGIKKVDSNSYEHPWICKKTFNFRAFSRGFCPERLTVIHTYIHTLMAVDAIQGADQQHQEQFGVQYLAQGHLAMQTRGTSNLLTTRRWLYPWAKKCSEKWLLEWLWKRAIDFGLSILESWNKVISLRAIVSISLVLWPADVNIDLAE